MGLVYHLMPPADWDRFLASGEYKPDSLASEGFIHCSTREQVLDTARRFFGHLPDLLALEIPERAVKSILKYEAAESGGLFPHLYGPLSLHQVETLHMLVRKPDGSWEWVR
ncbi:MAG: DUF952 domain-containing protein [Bacteroidia bacterium]|nr:DUF952 domain-containing protein [Bacteroidia bacterium]